MDVDFVGYAFSHFPGCVQRKRPKRGKVGLWTLPQTNMEQQLGLLIEDRLLNRMLQGSSFFRGGIVQYAWRASGGYEILGESQVHARSFAS